MQRWTISRSDCDVRWKVDCNMITSDEQGSGWIEKTFQSTCKSQTCTKKRSWSLFGGLLPKWSTTLSESRWNHYIWEVCSANWRDAWKLQCLKLALVNRLGPIVHCTTNASEVEWNGLQSFASSAIFTTWPPANQVPLLQASQQIFAGKTLLQPAGGRKYFPRVHWIPKLGFLHYRNKLISRWQKCVDCNGSYFE